jgi:putative copper export protein
MLPDLLSASLRGLAFMAILQAGGAAIFLALFNPTDRSRHRIRKLALVAAVASFPLLCVQYLLEATRMTGTFSGVFDWELQEFVLQSAAARVLGVRLLGMLLVVGSLRSIGRAARVVGFIGALLIAASFTLTGHIASSPAHTILGVALVVHVLVIEFWFGSLLLLRISCVEGEGIRVAQLIRRFSATATVMVPLIFAAGLIMMIGLLPGVAAVRNEYGLALVAKASVFALLMLLASLNKLRYGPALAIGDPAARRWFRATVLAEYAIIAAVLMGTAALTTFWSPEAGSV